MQATSKFRQLLPRLLPPINSINYTDFHNFLGKHALQTPLGKSRLMAPFLPQPPISQTQMLTVKLIETPGVVTRTAFVGDILTSVSST